MKSSFNNKNNKIRGSSMSNSKMFSEGEETEAGESLFYSAMDTLKSSARSPFAQNRNEITNNANDQSVYEESPRASVIYLESTMENSDLPITISSSNVIRKYKDLKWAALFITSTLSWLCSGIIILLKANQTPDIEAEIYDIMLKSIRSLTLLATSTLLIFVVWIYFLANFTKKTTLGTITALPLLLFSAFLCMLINSFRSNPADKELLLIALILLAITILYTKLVRSQVHHISKTTSIIEYVFDIIQSNASILVLSLVLFLVFVIFTTIWILFFTRLWLIGDVDQNNIFISKDRAYVISIFYIFYYIWTCTLIINIQRFASSFIATQQYFHQHEPRNLNWKSILTRATTTSFGTLILCSLILRTIYFLNYTCSYFKHHFERNSITAPVYVIIDWLDRLAINHYIVSFIGMTEDAFYPAIKSSNALFRRNLLTGLFSDFLTEIVLLISPCLFSICTGFFITQYDGLVTSSLVTMILLFMIQFFSYFMMSIVESRFICYAIDIDTNQIRSPETHTIYSNFD